MMLFSFCPAVAKVSKCDRDKKNTGDPSMSSHETFARLLLLFCDRVPTNITPQHHLLTIGMRWRENGLLQALAHDVDFFKHNKSEKYD